MRDFLYAKLMIVVLKMRHPWAQNASSLGAKCVILGRKMRHPWAQNASSLGAIL
jgi:hypothetical protein